MLAVFGATSVTMMMLCYALESRHRAWTFAFAAACFASSIYFERRKGGCISPSCSTCFLVA
jgi:hypothetical protein